MDTISEEMQEMAQDLQELDLSKQPKRKTKKTPVQMQQCIEEILSIIDSLKPGLKKLQIEGGDGYKSLHKKMKQLQKASNSQNQKKIKHGPERVTGFTKPYDVLPPVVAFFGTPKRESRSKVTGFVNRYIEAKNLQIPGNAAFFSFDEHLANLFNAKVNDVDCYRLFTQRVKFAFPIVPKVPTIKSLASLGDAGVSDADAVVVLSYNPEFLLNYDDTSLFQDQILTNRAVSVFCDAKAEFSVPQHVLFFVVEVEELKDFKVFAQCRGRLPTTIALNDFSVDWLKRALDPYIGATN